MTMTVQKHAPGEYYRREFKLEQYQEESSHSYTETSELLRLNQSTHFTIVTLVVILFIGSISLLFLGLWLPRNRGDGECSVQQNRSPVVGPPPKNKPADQFSSSPPTHIFI